MSFKYDTITVRHYNYSKLFKSENKIWILECHKQLSIVLCLVMLHLALLLF